MPNAYFILFELIVYAQLALCLNHARKHGTANLLKLAFGILFGVSLELATIRQLHAYQYGQFLLMVWDVPLCIGVAWSCIIYTAMEFSDASNLPYFFRPVLDGLLALNIDLALDAVAIRFGFWDWGQGLQSQYFGVPYPNFWAWFWVVFFFSLGYRILERNGKWTGKWLSAPLAYAVGLVGVLGTNFVIAFLVPPALRLYVVGAAILLALALTIIRRPQFYLRPVDSSAFWIPFSTHAYILIAGLISGVILQPPFLLFVGILMSISSLALHGKTARSIFLPTR
ncbi:MAG: carotenoid biosynthesis protein [Anaerolineales bacterium]|nr:carotenoid biosynthesis protein [Anaerolineales bacterium]